MTLDFNYQYDFSEQAEREILSMLEAQGFSLPNENWLRDKLHDIANRFHWSAERRKKDTHQTNVDGWKRLQVAVTSTIQYLDSQQLELSSATTFGDGARLPDSWDDEPPIPMSDEELEACLVPAEFTAGDVETAKRVLHHLLASAADMADGMEKWLEGRPVKNEQPEIDGLIRGLTRLWCMAFKIPVAHVRISASAGSPAMNFIERAIILFMEKALSRASIEARVIAYRDEAKARLS